ncbi:hypothetical protein Tco_1167359 [Tanacetum coccineum]
MNMMMVMTDGVSVKPQHEHPLVVVVHYHRNKTTLGGWWLSPRQTPLWCRYDDDDDGGGERVAVATAGGGGGEWGRVTYGTSVPNSSSKTGSKTTQKYQPRVQDRCGGGDVGGGGVIATAVSRGDGGDGGSRKIPPEKFSGGGDVVVAGMLAGEDDRRWRQLGGGRRWSPENFSGDGSRWPAVGKGGERGERSYISVSGKTEKLSGMSFHIELL